MVTLAAKLDWTVVRHGHRITLCGAYVDYAVQAPIGRPFKDDKTYPPRGHTPESVRG